MALRWGIAGAGKISSDFVCALQTHPKENHKIVAVAARSLETAQIFAENHNISAAYEGYEKIAKDKNVEIVYIGLLNPAHLQISKLMLEHGKHVLCEKPLTTSLKESRELIDYAAKQKKLFLMEGVWSRCFPVYDELRKQLDEGIIGEVVQVNVDFGLPVEHVDRFKVKEMGGSAILNLGVYVLQFSQFVYRGEKPVSILSLGYMNNCGTDVAAAAILKYPKGRTSILTVNTRVELLNTAYIYGTKGSIKIPSFWCPTTMITPSGTVNFELPHSSSTYNYHNSAGLAYEAEEARKCIRAGLIESSKIRHRESLELAEIMDILRRNVDVSLLET